MADAPNTGGWVGVAVGLDQTAAPALDHYAPSAPELPGGPVLMQWFRVPGCNCQACRLAALQNIFAYGSTGCTMPTFTPNPPIETPQDRAQRLLQANLPKAEAVIEVKGGLSGATYTVRQASSSAVMVHLRDPQDRCSVSFCVYSREGYSGLHPWQDEMLLFALYIQHDEGRFLRTAVPHAGQPRAKELYCDVRDKVLGLAAETTAPVAGRG